MLSVLSLIRHWGLPVVLIACLPFYFMEGRFGEDQELEQALWNLSHIIYFALVIVALRHHLDMRNWPHWLTISLAVFLVSIIGDYIQYEVGQERGWENIERNLIGAWLGIFWLNKGGPQVWVGRLIATGLLIQQVSVIGFAAYTEYTLATQMPLLSSLEEMYEEQWWEGPTEPSQKYVSHGDYSLKLTLAPSGYSGASLTTLQNNWTGYDTLIFDVYNPQLTPIKLTLRISDRQHEIRTGAFSDRFHQPFVAEHGWNQVEVQLNRVKQGPAEREMDMSELAQLEIFSTGGLKNERVVYLDNFRLRTNKRPLERAHPK